MNWTNPTLVKIFTDIRPFRFLVVRQLREDSKNTTFTFETRKLALDIET